MIAEFSKRSRRVIALSAATFLTPFALVGVAHAAGTEAAADPAPAEADGGGLGDIVVTATRRSESVQKVPISMQALSMEKLAERNVKGMSDFALLMPSVSFAGLGPGRQTAYFRGIVPAGGTYASVGYYLDDIPITGTGVPDVFVYDMERVEGLSGPQGTLYGAGSLAGTIRMITNKPKLGKFEWGYDSEVNKFGKGAAGGQLATYANIPVGDNLAARVVAFYRKDGGYVDNTPNNGKFNNGKSSTLALGDGNPGTNYTLSNAAIAKKDYNPVYMYGGRLAVLWEPTPGWQITPELAAQSQTAYGYFGYDPRVGDLQVHDYDLTRRQDAWYQGALSVHGHIGDFDLVSSTGYFGRKVHLQNDYTYYTVTYDNFGQGYENYLQFFSKDGCTGSGASLKCNKLLNPTQYFEGWTYSEKFTQELRFATPKSWPFDASFGGFYQWQKTENNNYYGIHGLADIAGYTKVCSYSFNSVCNGDVNTLAGFGVPTTSGGTMVVGSPAVKGDGFYINENNQYTHDAAIFFEGHYNITPKLKITGGVRYFWTDYWTTGFAGVMASAKSTTTSKNMLTGAMGCSLPLPTERLTCRNTNMLDPNQIGRYKEQGETHKIALNYQLTPSKMVYANYSTGFRPGGYNRPLRVSGVGVFRVDPFKSETLTNYEIGIKTQWGNNVRFNTAIYMEEWNNIQYSVVVAGTQGAGMTGNAGKAKVYGVEYEADIKLGKVTISSSGAYNRARLDGNFCNFKADRTALTIAADPTCSSGIAAADGSRLPRQPEFKGNISVRYDTEFGDLKAYLLGSALYQSSATQDLKLSNNNLLDCQDIAADATKAGRQCTTKGFATFDFSAGLKKDTWAFDIYIQNAFDGRGVLTTNTFCSIDFCAGSSRNFTVRPQVFGVKFGQKF
ncbi:TonB-dependent receptor [Novosphingobium sp. KACC 22771]|uniref:TonB-dependent receptor n=1 Tax=Novosphingobium sp. KACC 22771 TaxID=3025670 RepID=UPI002366501E|nr:TonB-dependent receptor [Novosphingobium sp. KACC 22771]WDF72051.1 TonB-dependent receptor [Novosphingobium sp. KACC 22771]